MDFLREMIETLEARMDRDELEEMLLQRLYDKMAELDDGLTDEEAKQLIFAEKQMIAQECYGEDAFPEGWDPGMLKCMDAIREVLAKLEIGYLERYDDDEGIYVFESRVSIMEKDLQMWVYLENDPKVCKICAVYPFQADPKMIYPLCWEMAKENHKRSFGAVKYDHNNRHLYLEYCFSIEHGLYPDDFERLYLTVLFSAEDSFAGLYCTALGKLTNPMYTEITCQAQKLLIELSKWQHL